MAYNLHPGVDPQYNFPPEIRRSLAVSPELRYTVVPMSTPTRNNLPESQKWDNRVITNTTTDHLERWDAGLGQWVPIPNNPDYVPITGTTMTGPLTLELDATAGVQAINKKYADSGQSLAGYAEGYIPTTSHPTSYVLQITPNFVAKALVNAVGYKVYLQRAGWWLVDLQVHYYPNKSSPSHRFFTTLTPFLCPIGTLQPARAFIGYQDEYISNSLLICVDGVNSYFTMDSYQASGLNTYTIDGRWSAKFLGQTH